MKKLFVESNINQKKNYQYQSKYYTSFNININNLFISGNIIFGNHLDPQLTVYHKILNLIGGPYSSNERNI